MSPCVNGGPSVALPRVIVADVVDERILIWLEVQDVPVVGVVKESIAMILQFGWRAIHLAKHDDLKSIKCNLPY